MDTIELKWKCNNDCKTEHNAIVTGENARYVTFTAFAELMRDEENVNANSIHVYVNGKDETLSISIAYLMTVI